MRIFLTGATGFIGSAIVPELLHAGHQVLGLTRSDAGARSLAAAGAEAHRGDLQDLHSLRAGAAQSDGVIHCAFDHDFSQFAANCEKDRRAIEALGFRANRLYAPARYHVGYRHGKFGAGSARDRRSLQSGASESAQGVGIDRRCDGGSRRNVSIVRLPQVHDPVKQGLISPFIEMARAKGVVAYIGDGLNRFPAVHVLDAARVYKLAIERQAAGGRYHAVGEEGIPVRDIAEVIGRGLQLPVVSVSAAEAPAHFGWLAAFMGFDMPASSAQTQQVLGWHPTGPGLIADLERMRFFLKPDFATKRFGIEQPKQSYAPIIETTWPAVRRNSHLLPGDTE